MAVVPDYGTEQSCRAPASHSRFHPGAFPGMFKSALCVCVPSGHFKIAQNIQSPETGNPPSLPLPVSTFSWVGTGALLTSGKRMQEAFQMPAPSLGIQQGHLVGKKVASHPSGPRTSLDSKKSIGPCLLQEGGNPFGISFNSIIY